MMRGKKLTRRSLLQAGALAGVGGAAAVATSARGAEEFEFPITASSLGTVSSVKSPGTLEIARVADSRVPDVADLNAAVAQFGEGVLAQPPGTTVTITAPGSEGVWHPGHRAVLHERYLNDGWEVFAVQHLFEKIEAQKVLERHGPTLETDEGVLELTPESEPALEEWTAAEPVPLQQIESGDTVAGLGHLSPDRHEIEVTRLGLKDAS